MDRKTPSKKEDKVGPDGLTKKERRALKIQARQTDDNKVQMKDSEKKQASPALKITETSLKCTLPDATNVKQSDAISEKEKRKLEWEKKLAEQKVEKKTTELSKAELKAKRREQQEAQRLAKTQQVQLNIQTEAKQTVKKPIEKTTSRTEKAVDKRISPKKDIIKKVNLAGKVQLVHHLYTDAGLLNIDKSLAIHSSVHPAFVTLGVQHASKTILGSNARCLSLLAAVLNVIDDLRPSSKHEFCRHLESVLQSCTNHLQQCRPFAVSMSNALRAFKLYLTKVETNLPDGDKKLKLRGFIETFIQDEMKIAGEAISIKVSEKISDGDVILTYGCSSLVTKILIDAKMKYGKNFNVIVVDGRPLLEGREMLRKLVDKGIKCTYVLINAISYVMSSVTKVLLGAHALLNNGYVMSRIGTAQVAMVAHAYNKSVLVCCETYKFSEKVQTDSLVYNEIGDTETMFNIDTLEGPSPLLSCRENNKLIPLNLLYDVTPPDLVTAVVTELAILPCTSVPVVLRIKPTEIY